LAAPLWFDRGPGALPGDSIAQEGIRRGILVCPGSFFGDPTGVRLCLTRRTFPGDLLKYLDLRGSFLDSSYDGAIGGECERPR
jgi:aspartate/methionine/tyrosine aminotransferase